VNVSVEPAAAVNELEPVPVHPLHEIVRLPLVCVVTVRVVLPLTPPWLAVMVVVPVAIAVANPLLLIVALL